MLIRARAEQGQASVELVAVVPLVLLVGLLLWQLAVAAQALWLCGNAARVAARAQAVGRDAGVAARSAVPAGLRGGLRVSRSGGEAVRVRLPVPILVRAWHGPLSV